AGRIHRDDAAGHVLVAGVSEHSLDDAFGLRILSFAEMMMADLAVAIDEIMRWPVFVVERAPDLVLVIDGDGVGDLEPRNRTLHIVNIALEGEFRRVHADHDEAMIAIFLGPGADIG